MPKKVDHEKRKDLIFTKALEVFATTGFHNTSLSLIALKCGLSRTSVYEYFKDQSEIFSYGIIKTTENMFEKYTSSKWEKENKLEQLTQVCNDVINVASSHEKEISNFVKVLDELEIDIDSIIHRRTARLRLFLCRTIRSGINNNQIKKINAEDCVDKIFNLIESFCFQMSLVGKKNAALTKELLDMYLESLKA